MSKLEWRNWSLYRVTSGRGFSHVFDCWVEYGGSDRLFTINPRFLWQNFRDWICRDAPTATDGQTLS